MSPHAMMIVVDHANKSAELFTVFGSLMHIIVRTFFGIGWMPLCVTQYPEYSNLPFTKKDFLALTLIPA
jgi:hypothetical protein